MSFATTSMMFTYPVSTGPATDLILFRLLVNLFYTE